MPVRYVITTLKPGVKPEDYERWLREYDYRVAKTLPSIVSYRTHRIEGPITGLEAAPAIRAVAPQMRWPPVSYVGVRNAMPRRMSRRSP